jgi:multiple sugar transport system permease protein
MTSTLGARLFAFALLAPALLYVLAIVAWPLVDTVHLSFTNASLRPIPDWVGWDNYTKIFRSGFGDIIIRTIIWTAISVSTKMVIGLCGACLLNAAIPGRALFRVMTMPPWIVPMAIGIFMWGWLYNGQFGMISGLLQRFGLTDGPIAFLAHADTAFFATIFTDVWIGVPMVTFYFLAAMQSIPKDLHEAAWSDGAGRLYRFRRITLPMMVPAMVTMSLLSLIATFNSFDIIWILTRGGPSGATTTMIIDTYKTAMGSYRYGEGAARAVLVGLCLGVFCVMYFRVIARISRASWRG